MAYPPRIQEPGQLFHAYAHGVDGCAIYCDDGDYLTFLALLERECRRSDWTPLVYTLMRTHYHLLVELRRPTLSSGFQRLQSTYARSYNRTHGRRGALWEKRFDAKLIEHDGQLFETIRYIAWNAPKVRPIARPEDYRWCSYGAAIGSRPTDRIVDEERLLRLFSRDAVDARRELQAFVNENDPRRQIVL
jgi:hypothetical protein